MDVICEGLTLGRGTFRLSANWMLPSGASLALIGPSGAGKSLFLGALAGFETIHSGRVKFGADDMSAVPPAARPVTLMFQDHNLFPHLSVSQNVGLGVDPGLKLSPEGEARVAAALRDVALEGYDARYPSELSGGQQSRVALARALTRRKPILLLDEPFSALGPGLRRDMLALVERIRTEHQMSLIYVTHSPEDARQADFTAFVEGGVVSAPTETAALFADPPATLQDYL